MRIRRIQRGEWIPLAATAASSLINYLGQKNTNESNVNLNKENRDFQERMSSTAHQREVQDLQAAGLNPMLSVTRGGASTPSGSVARVENAAAAGTSGAAAAAETMRGVQGIRQSEAQQDLIVAQAAEIRSRTVSNATNTAYMLAQIDNLTQSANLSNARYQSEYEQLVQDLKTGAFKFRSSATEADMQRKWAEVGLTEEEKTLAAARAKSAQYGLVQDEAESRYFQDVGKGDKYLDRALSLIGMGSGVARTVSSARAAADAMKIGRRNAATNERNAQTNAGRLYHQTMKD